MISGLIGSVPTTTYGENIGVMAITGVYSVQVIAGAAIISIICSFVGPLSALIQIITKITGSIIKIALISNFGVVKLGKANNGASITAEKSTNPKHIAAI